MDIDFCAALKQLERNEIAELNLRERGIGPIGAQLVADALKINQSLHTLLLRDNSIGHTGAHYLAEALKVNKSLCTLNLDRNSLGSADSAHLDEEVKVNNSLHSLHLEKNGMSSTGAQYIAEALKVNTSLHTLYLRQNRIGLDGVQLLAASLEDNQSLHTLDLGWNLLGSFGAQKLAKALKVNKTLHSLYLRQSKIDSTGVQHLAEALQVNQTLHTLDLWGNPLGSMGMYHLSEALMVNQSLKALNVRWSEIDSIGAQLLAAAFKINQSLLQLDLRDNNIGSTGTYHLAEALKINKTLQTLDLGGNEIGSSSIQHLAEALKVNKSLHILDLSGSEMSYIDAQAFSEAFNTNNTLHTLRLGRNRTINACSKDFMNKYLLLHEKNRNEDPSDDPRENFTHKYFEQDDRNKQIYSELVSLLHQKEDIEGRLKIAKLKSSHDILAPGDDEEVNFRLREMEQLFQHIQLLVEKILRELRDTGASELFNAAEQILFNFGGVTSSDRISRIEKILLRAGKWMKRDLTNYSNPVDLDLYGSIIEATNLHGERVILKKISLSPKHLFKAAMNEVTVLLKQQGRPNIIELNGAFIRTEHGTKQVVMEMPLYGTGNLMHWLKGMISSNREPYDGHRLRSLPVSSSHDQETILQLLLKIIESVGEIHNSGVEHRDLKPESILVDDQGHPKLIDFGNSKQKEEASSFQSSSPSQELESHDPGSYTRYYAPPEVVAGSSTDVSREFGKWDVYSMGVIIYESLCSPDDWDRIETLYETQAEADAVLSESGQFKGWIRDLVLRMLHREASSRPSIKEAAFEIGQNLLDRHSELQRKLR